MIWRMLVLSIMKETQKSRGFQISQHFLAFLFLLIYISFSQPDGEIFENKHFYVGMGPQYQKAF